MTPFTTAGTLRVIAGALVAATTVVAAIAIVGVGAPGRTRDAVSISAEPPATTSVASCTGPLLASGRDSSQAALLMDAAPQSVTAGAGEGASFDTSTLSSPDVPGGAGAAVSTAAPVDSKRSDLAAAGSSRAREEDLAGFAATACTRPAMESWLVAGSATTGASDLVTLANPGEVAALVTLTVYASEGPVTPAAGEGIVVAAGTQRVIPLAALALGEENPIIRVTAAQAPVSAALQAKLTRVLVPGGVDQVSAAGAPVSDLVIPGVPVTLAPGDAGASDNPVSLRLLAPAAGGAATITVRGEDGVVGKPQEVTLVAGVPLQVDLPGLPIGTYTVSIASPTPVTGAVWVTTGFGKGSDFGWFSAADILAAPTLVAVPAGASPRLTLVSAGDTDQTVRLIGDDGAKEISLAAGAMVVVPVSAGHVFRIEPGAAGVRAAVTFAATGAVAGYPVPAGDAAASAIVVYPR